MSYRKHDGDMHVLEEIGTRHVSPITKHRIQKPLRSAEVEFCLNKEL